MSERSVMERKRSVEAFNFPKALMDVVPVKYTRALSRPPKRLEALTDVFPAFTNVLYMLN